MSPYFRFESDFVGSLRCIPMAVRLKLDVTGIKLKLMEWSKLDKAGRQALAEWPCEAPEEIQAYRMKTMLRIAEVCGAPPALLTEPINFSWKDAETIPTQVHEKAAALGVKVTSKAWQALMPLQRFALEKLSRPGHEGRNFLPALIEFEITS